jgi:hypothetical protein
MDQHIDLESYICSDEWRSYRACNIVFAGHGRVNHSVNFINPPRDQDPIWVDAGRFNVECLDKQWSGPIPRPGVEPFRVHTQNGERSWRELKSTLRSCNNLDLAELYIGEYMYRKNILDSIEDTTGKMERFLRDIARVHPGIGRTKMGLNIENCNCHECQ